MRIVVTGGAGFIGSNLAKHFDKKGDEVLVIDIFRNSDRFSNGNLKSFGHYKNLLGFEGEILEGDINDKATLKKIKKFRPDTIFHQAAISDTTVSEQDLLIRTNLNSFSHLIEIAKDLNSKLIYASSAATYGNAKSPQTVGECESPRNVYGFSKLMMDKLAFKFFKKLHIIGFRYFNVYGSGEYFKDKTASMVLQFGLQILSGKAPKLFEGSDKIKRDFVYIKDIVLGNELALNAKKSGIYNLATGKARSFQNIADILQRELGTNLGSEYIKNPFVKQYQFHTQANILDTKTDLGYEPKFSLEDGIKDYISEINRIYESEVNG
ncbi:ADP-glyceromanno-heptose 6-epimerase [Campylobacter corcagiensis]|uniref:ADP-glyceromanno-heptose 6-epimerase n=1 Tax=Campylobacter corcagiensis TaxID=1448857 RepID=A0A7M1LGZ0_9BACT|nr:ADP-glyceromanno-heptose 6-epimerase [Campylobacter corcagiensis]QKF65088.1 ADP-L-glycero-D-mannoheptose-6-epimerase [Campylobacter corcagiensis]QOQ86765.1 ADP-glyceromanno-heptose 6-epimerase [Campylobacter corcagiensis]